VIKIIAWLVTGLVAALLVKYVVAGDRPNGVAGDAAVAAVGALLGGWFVKSLAPAAPFINALSILSAFAGAALMLALLRFFARRQRAT